MRQIVHYNRTPSSSGKSYALFVAFLFSLIKYVKSLHWLMQTENFFAHVLDMAVSESSHHRSETPRQACTLAAYLNAFCYCCPPQPLSQLTYLLSNYILMPGAEQLNF